MAEGLPVDRLRAFLRDLDPEARTRLVTKLERSALHGTEVPGASLILAELRPSLRRATPPPARIGNPARLFFRPLEPFLMERGARVRAQYIERSSLDALWSWITTTLLPVSAKSYRERVVASLTAEDDAAARQVTRAFQDEAAQAIGATLEALQANEPARRRLAAQIGTARALEEVQTLHIALTHQHALARIGARLPAHIRNFGDQQVDNILALLKPNLAGREAALRLALILIAARLEVLPQLIRLAIRSAESDMAAKVAQSPFAPAVDMVLADMRYALEEMRDLCRRGRFAEALAPLKKIHDASRAIRTELDLQGDSAWGRELASIRAAASDFLKVEIESTLGWVRRLLRVRAGREAAPPLDAGAVAEVEGRVELVAACRNYASELAINQIAPRAYSELQAFLEAAVSTLIASLRHAEQADRHLRQAQVDAAVRFAGKFFGGDYAAVLAKAATLALERKPTRG